VQGEKAVTDNRLLWSCYGWKLSVHVPYLLFVCCALVLCLFLSNWQWQRATAADLRYSNYLQQSSLPALDLDEANQNYQKVAITGQIKNHFFLDNQVYQGVAGWHVLAEVQTHQELILVDLGWQAKNEALTLLEALPKEIEVQGLIKQAEPGLMLESAAHDPKWPRLLQQIEIPLLNEHFAYELSPFVLHAETHVAKLIPTPITLENKYAMHLGYAIQWLLIGCVGFSWFIYLCRQEQTEHETQ